MILKSSPMPESCDDRPTSSYDHVFLLSREPDYFYDRMAVAEPNSMAQRMKVSQTVPSSRSTRLTFRNTATMLATYSAGVSSRPICSSIH